MPTRCSILIITFAIAALLNACSDSATTVPDIKIAAPRETRTLINNFAPHREDCREDTNQSFTIPSQPKNGRAEITRGMITLTSSPFPSCVGKQVEAYQVFYTSSGTFKGIDPVIVRQVQNGANIDYRFLIAVD